LHWYSLLFRWVYQNQKYISKTTIKQCTLKEGCQFVNPWGKDHCGEKQATGIPPLIAGKAS
jgi:hypothetical protein